MRLSLVFLRASFLGALEYRASFFSGVFSTLLWVLLALVSISVITYQAPSVGGWNRLELFLVQGIYSTLFGFMYFVFIGNFKEIARLIRRGDLDYLLVKPCDSQLLVSIGKFSLYHLARVLAGIVLIGYSLTSLGINLQLQTVSLFFVFMFSSVVVVYSIWFMVVTLSIWLVDLFNLTELLTYITGLTRYPLEILRHLSNFLMYVIMPLVVVTTVPAQALLQKINLELAIWSIVLCIVFFSGSRFFWKFALRYYTSASS